MVAPRSDDDARRRVPDLERGPRVSDGDVAQAVPLVERRFPSALRGEARVQPAEVRGVDVALERLQPVARPLILEGAALGGRHERPRQLGQGRRIRLRPHVCPHDPLPLAARIRERADALAQPAVGRLGGHVDAGPGGVELPAVVHASQAALLVAPEVERRAPVRAGFREQSDASLRVAKDDEVLAEQPHALRRPVGRTELAGLHQREPVAAHQRAHRRAGAHPRQQLVVLGSHRGGILVAGRSNRVPAFAGRRPSARAPAASRTPSYGRPGRRCRPACPRAPGMRPSLRGRWPPPASSRSGRGRCCG